MKLRILKSLMSLTLLMSSTTLRAANGIPNPQFVNPAGGACYDKKEIGNIANYAKECELTKANFKTLEGQYSKCQAQTCETPLIGSNTLFFGSVIGALVLGFLAGSRR